MKTFKTVLLTFLLVMSLCLEAQEKDRIVKIGIPEVYELANVILAVTPYGIEDKWEVRKKGKYYDDMMAHFSKYRSHPLIEKVNYSREKWEEYLSFRTDAYAFSFDKKGHLKKDYSFRSTKFNEFEKNLALVEDFAKKSGYRKFYRRNRQYFDSLIVEYEKSQMLPQMRDFLEREFGDHVAGEANYAIALSPLVYRMHAQRMPNGVTTSFTMIPDAIILGTMDEESSQAQKASDLHMLFTELDHSFVNPTTDKYAELVNKNFDVSKWDAGSGYGKWELATFNEYMTWAVYDVFVYEYFPEVASSVCKVWARQNQTRGFIGSPQFNEKVLELYDRAKSEGKTLKDIYPELLEWCRNVEIRK